MLTDWERRKLAEIERGLVEDVTPRRARRLRPGIVKSRGLPTVALLLGCMTFLMIIGAYTIAVALGAVYTLVLIGRPARTRRGGEPVRWSHR